MAEPIVLATKTPTTAAPPKLLAKITLTLRDDGNALVQYEQLKELGQPRVDLARKMLNAGLKGLDVYGARFLGQVVKPTPADVAGVR